MSFPWLQWLPFRTWKVVGTVDFADEIPEELPPKSAIVVASGKRQKWVVFDCPCKTGHRIMLNLDPVRKPTWKLEVARRGQFTIHPSIDFHGNDRRCHYFVRDGKVRWT